MTVLLSNLDLNRRPDPLFKQVNFISSKDLKRIAHVAIPFLSLHSGMGVCISLGSAAGQVYHQFSEGRPDLKKVASLVITATVFFFNPTLSLFITHGSALIFMTNSLAQDILNRKTDELPKKGWCILSTAVYIASASCEDPLLITASLLMQAFQEFREALIEYKEGHYLETAGKFFMGLIRSTKAQVQVSEYYRQKYGKEITQSDWDCVIEELKIRIKENEGPEVEEHHQTLITQTAWKLIEENLWYQSDLEKILDQHNFKREIKGIRLEDPSCFEESSIRNIRFIACDLKGADFSSGTLENVHFDQCNMQRARFINTTIRNTWMSNCDLSWANFFQAKMRDFTVMSSNLYRTHFNDSWMENVQIIASKLFGANFLGVKAKKTLLKTCDLTDVLLLDATEQFQFDNCTENRFTRPVIALGWDFRYDSGANRCLMNESLENYDVLIVHYPFKMPSVSRDLLEEEVQTGIASYDGKGKSIPQHLMRKGPWGSQTKALYERARLIGKCIDGVILPGGADVEEEFYLGLPLSNWYTDYRRSMLEYALIHECIEMKKPLMGICRGTQVTNTYFPGGTIKDVEDQWKTQKLEFEANLSGEVLRKQLGGKIWGVSMHNQAVDQVGEGLEVALKADGVIKALLSKDGKILLTQFHPEQYVFSNKIEKRVEAGDPEILQEFTEYGVIEMLQKGFFDIPTCRYNEDRQIRVDREAVERWIARFERAVNAAFDDVKRVRNNTKLIDYFLSQAQKTEAAPAA